MAYSRFTEVPWASYSSTDEQPFLHLQHDGPYRVVAKSLAPLSRRKWQWVMKRLYDQADGSDGRNTLLDFFLGLTSLGKTPFLIRDVKDVRETDLNIGTGDGSTTVFYLPTSVTAETFRHFPFDDSTTIVKVAGVTITTGNRTIDTDNRKVTLAVAPTLGQAVTISYDFYRLAVFTSPSFDWTKSDESAIFGDVTPEITEIIRES